MIISSTLLKDTFQRIIRQLDNDDTYAENLWTEVEKAYSQKRRYYHHLGHLEYMLHKALAVKEDIEYWDVMIFSIVYHDIVYDITGKDNEEKSADIGIDRALNTGLGLEHSRLCGRQILATKGHESSEDPDTNYLTDLDLCILGDSPEVYQKYTVAIRKEYGIYPAFMYKKGRRKVLKHFLNMERIFKTEHFFKNYEAQARENLNMELSSL